MEICISIIIVIGLVFFADKEIRDMTIDLLANIMVDIYLKVRKP